MAACSDYAKHVAVRIERTGLLVHTSVVSGEADVMDAVSEAMHRGCLFALSIIGHQSSSTLYILHGQPEGSTCSYLTVISSNLLLNLKHLKQNAITC